MKLDRRGRRAQIYAYRNTQQKSSVNDEKHLNMHAWTLSKKSNNTLCSSERINFSPASPRAHCLFCQPVLFAYILLPFFHSVMISNASISFYHHHPSIVGHYLQRVEAKAWSEPSHHATEGRSGLKCYNKKKESCIDQIKTFSYRPTDLLIQLQVFAWSPT